VNCDVTQHVSCYVALINLQSCEVKKCLKSRYDLSVEIPLQGKLSLRCKRLH
jgi:hypothetical protein